MSLFPQQYSISPAAQTGMDIIAAGLQPDLGLGDVVGLMCDDYQLLSSGSGSTGTTVVVSPQSPILPLGNNIQFSAVVNGPDAASGVNWSVNGVQGGSGLYGTITASGLYTAPQSLPTRAYVSVTATSAGDPSATAGTNVQIVLAVPGTITTVAGDGTAGYSGDGGPSVSATLYHPSGLAFDGGGNLFITDSANNVVRRVDATTHTISTIAGTGVAGYNGDGGLGVTAELNQPTHVVFDSTVNLYITDANNQRIRRVDALTDEITTVAGNGLAGFAGDGGPATSAELNYPDGVALDTNGNLFIGDAQNNRIREVSISNGNIATVAGDGVPGYSGDGGIATNAELNFPSRPDVDTSGNIYIADYQNNRVREVNAATGIITTIAGNGVAGFSGDGGPATAAELNGPLSVAVDSKGVVYIADSINERIRAVNTTKNPITVMGIAIQPGDIQTLVGSGQAGYYGDGGLGTNAEVNTPTGLTLDLDGNLYFADLHNNVIREVIGQ